VGSSHPNGIEGLCPATRPEPRPAARTEILSWSVRWERAEALLPPRRSLVTLAATKGTEIVEQGRSRQRKSPVGSLDSADLVSKALAALRPDGLCGRADRHRSMSHQRNWAAKSRYERAWCEKCSTPCELLDRRHRCAARFLLIVSEEPTVVVIVLPA